MPRGTTNWKSNDAMMGNVTYVKFLEEPAQYVFEGIGKATEGKFGPQTPIYLQDIKTREALQLSAFAQQYNAFKKAELDVWDIVEIKVVKTPKLTEDGEPAFKKNGEPASNYDYTVKKKGNAGAPVNEDGTVEIDDLPF